MSASPAATQLVFVASLLRSVTEAGEGVLTLAEGLMDDELRRSRLTRRALLTLLEQIASAMTAVPPEARQTMPEIDWDGWLALPPGLHATDPDQAHDALVTGVQAMVPATLMWLRVYQPQMPQWFDITQVA